MKAFRLTGAAARTYYRGFSGHATRVVIRDVPALARGQCDTSLPVGLLLAADRATEYKIDDGVDLRGGAEVSVPLGSVSLQVRGGVYSEAPRGIQFGGLSTVESGTFAGVRRQTVATAGAFVVVGVFHLEFGGSFGGERTTIGTGARVRF